MVATVTLVTWYDPQERTRREWWGSHTTQVPGNLV